MGKFIMYKHFLVKLFFYNIQEGIVENIFYQESWQ